MSLEMISQQCPNCNGTLDYLGDGVLECPFCSAKFYDGDRAKLDMEGKAAEGAGGVDGLSDDEVADIVYEAVCEYGDPDGYGVQIAFDGKTLSKEDKARQNFLIDDDETIFMIFDETMFGSCKEGYVITDAGLHVTDDDRDVHFLDWEKLCEAEIEAVGDMEIRLNHVTFTLTGDDSRDNSYDLLCDIVDRLSE